MILDLRPLVPESGSKPTPLSVILSIGFPCLDSVSSIKIWLAWEYFSESQSIHYGFLRDAKQTGAMVLSIILTNFPHLKVNRGSLNPSCRKSG
jgi:hypothetical protein